MAWSGGPSGDDRTPDPFADGPGEPSPLALSVPDDARELSDEIAAYRKEIRARERRERFDRLTLARYWRPYGITGPVVIAALVVIGSVGGLLLALLPSTQQPGAQADLLANAAQRTGEVGGLLLDDVVQVDGTSESARVLRPGVLALVPPNCNCATTIDHVAGQATQFGLVTYVVSAQPGDPQMQTLTRSSTGRRSAVYDPGDRLRVTYSPKNNGVTLIVVRKDGVVRGVLKNVTSDTTMSAALTLLDQPAA